MRVTIEFGLPRMPDPWDVCRLVTAGALAMFVLLLLTGCEAWGKKETEYVPYEVRVPVPVPCAAETPPEPTWATDSLRKADSGDEKAKALLAEREQRKGYEAKLKATTEGCRR